MKTIGEKLGHILVPMVTPFHPQTEDVNYDLAAKLADALVASGNCDTVIVAGTTGEFNTLLHEERLELMRVVKDAVAGRVPIVAGTGAGSAREAAMLTRAAADMGYDAAMVVAPYYCKPTQRGIYEYYAHIAKAADIDIMLYNIPIFTGVNIDPDTVARLSEIPNVRGIKDESGVNPTQISEYRRVTPEDFTIYNGDDIMVLCGLIQGAAGVVSGGAHVVGGHIRSMINAFVQGNVAEAQRIHHNLDPLYKAFCPNGRVNPIPVLRAAIELTGMPVGRVRMPLDAATPEETQAIRSHLERLGVL